MQNKNKYNNSQKIPVIYNKIMNQMHSKYLIIIWYQEIMIELLKYLIAKIKFHFQ